MFWQDNQPLGFETFTVLKDVEAESELQEWVDLGASYPILGDYDRAIHSDFGVDDTPEMVVIRSDGTIVYRGRSRASRMDNARSNSTRASSYRPRSKRTVPRLLRQMETT